MLQNVIYLAPFSPGVVLLLCFRLFWIPLSYNNNNNLSVKAAISHHKRLTESFQKNKTHGSIAKSMKNSY